MTDQQKAELIALVEKGSQAKVGYYYSACVMFEYPEGSGHICAEKWGFALIGKFGDPAVALKKYEEVHNALPQSNPGCLQMLYAVAQLLGIKEWKELVGIHYFHNYSGNRREDEVAEFKRVVSTGDYTQAIVTTEDFAEYEDQLIFGDGGPIVTC